MLNFLKVKKTKEKQIPYKQTADSLKKKKNKEMEEILPELGRRSMVPLSVAHWQSRHSLSSLPAVVCCSCCSWPSWLSCLTSSVRVGGTGGGGGNRGSKKTELDPAERSKANALFIRAQASAAGSSGGGAAAAELECIRFDCQKRQKSWSSIGPVERAANNDDESDMDPTSGHDRRAVSMTSTPLHQASSSISSKSGPCSSTSSSTDDMPWMTDVQGLNSCANNSRTSQCGHVWRLRQTVAICKKKKKIQNYFKCYFHSTNSRFKKTYPFRSDYTAGRKDV